jgi:hypothetical protein
MTLTENLDTFLADFGVTVVWGLVSGLGIFESPDQTIGGGLGISSEYSILVKTSVFGAAAYADAITVGGVSYTVREVRKIDDGSFCRIVLSKV